MRVPASGTFASADELNDYIKVWMRFIHVWGVTSIHSADFMGFLWRNQNLCGITGFAELKKISQN